MPNLKFAQAAICFPFRDVSCVRVSAACVMLQRVYHCHVAVGQDGKILTVYPKHAVHENIANAAGSSRTMPVDALSMANNTDEMHAVQALAKLETCTINLGKVKMLQAEEERLLEVDESSILKMDLQSGRLAPALVTFSTSIRSLASFLAALPGSAAEKEPLCTYSLASAVKDLDGLHLLELHRAVDRWKESLTAIGTELENAFPPEWRAKCVDTYDVEFVKSKILVQTLIDDLGTEFVDCSKWLKSLDKIEPVKAAFEARWEAELKAVRKNVKDANDITSAILSYNVLVYQFPKKKSDQRRQIVKDLKKKLKVKLGPKAEIPTEISDRLTMAISGK